MRRPPFGLIAPTANDMAANISRHAWAGLHDRPVPRGNPFLEDPSVIGAPFSVVSMVDGPSFRSAMDGARLDSAQTLPVPPPPFYGVGDVAIHAVPYLDVGLRFTRPSRWLSDRQIDRWRRQWSSVATAPMARIHDLYSQLVAVVPEGGPPTFVMEIIVWTTSF